MTIQEAKDTIAKKHQLKDWKYVLHLFLSREINAIEYNILEKEAFEVYASECCKQQREDCAEDLPTDTSKLAIECILSTPLVVEVKQ